MDYTPIPSTGDDDDGSTTQSTPLLLPSKTSPHSTNATSPSFTDDNVILPRTAPPSTSTSSSNSDESIQDPSTNDLSLISSAALLTADCVGTGILALPNDVQVLGTALGITFIILNLPINLYAGTILGKAASAVEYTLHGGGRRKRHLILEEEIDDGSVRLVRTVRAEDMVLSPFRRMHSNLNPSKRGVEEADRGAGGISSSGTPLLGEGHAAGGQQRQRELTDDEHHPSSPRDHDDQHHHQHHQHLDVPTYDFIGMTSYLFPNTKRPTRIVMTFYYTNIFLVLGNYILVMSRAVAAMIGEDNICVPVAGVIASTLMLAICQFRTMAKLGHYASVLSLVALGIVVAQCIVALRDTNAEPYKEAEEEEKEEVNRLLRKFAALASIMFAVCSQKLFLNIRHEMKDRSLAAPGSLGISLGIFGVGYVAVCLLAGSDPPAFLFDAIPPGTSRRIAGSLLWIHVAVSFAINSQALCSSIDRLAFHRITKCNLNEKHRLRWAVLTVLVSTSSYLVANAVPFFTDLVALIGSSTLIPLTLLLPALLYRKVCRIPMFVPTRDGWMSYGLLVFGIVFFVVGLVGSIGSIELDWSRRGPPFGCR